MDLVFVYKNAICSCEYNYSSVSCTSKNKIDVSAQLVGGKNTTGSSWLMIYCPYITIPTASLGLIRSIRLMPD